MSKNATKTQQEREEEAIADNLHSSPKDLPPRYDLRDRDISESDPDLNEKDPDMSLNYKNALYHGPPGPLTDSDPQKPWSGGWSRKDVRDLTDQDFSAILSESQKLVDDVLLAHDREIALRNALDFAIHTCGNGLYDHLIDSPTYNFLLAALEESLFGNSTIIASDKTVENRPFMNDQRSMALAPKFARDSVNASEDNVQKYSAQQVKGITSQLDKFAHELENNWKTLGLPQKLAMQASFLIDRVSDAMEKRVVASVIQGDPDDKATHDLYNKSGPVDGQADADEEYMSFFEGSPDMPARQSGDAVSGRSEPSELKHQEESNPWADPVEQQPSQPKVHDKADSRSYVSSYRPVTKAGASLHRKLFSLR